MKKLLCKTLALAVGASPSALAFSLYDTAPAVGVPESYAAHYEANITGGYDTNPSGSSSKKGRKAGVYANGSVSTRFADVESVDKLTYTVRLGATYYFSGGEAGKKYYGDCMLSAMHVHAFSEMSRNTISLNATYRPEPGYDNGMSGQGHLGDTLSWSASDTYSQAIDSRWSWNVTGSCYGTRYEHRSTAQDDREYLTGSLGLHYRESDRLTYMLSTSGREELRTYGASSRSLYATGGFQYALDIVSTCSLSTGVQCKTMDSRSKLSPTLDAGYRRRVTDGLSINTYARYSDENADCYNSRQGSTYRSSMSWRVGASGTYTLSPDVTFSFSLSYMHASQKRATGGTGHTPSSSRETFNPSVSMRYTFSPEVSGSLGCEYTYYISRSYSNMSYERWRFFSGISYSF